MWFSYHFNEVLFLFLMYTQCFCSRCYEISKTTYSIVIRRGTINKWEKVNSLQVLNLRQDQTLCVQERQGSGRAQEWQQSHKCIWKHACETAAVHSLTSECLHWILRKMRNPFWHFRWVSQPLGWKAEFVRLKLAALLEALKWIMMTFTGLCHNSVDVCQFNCWL